MEFVLDKINIMLLATICLNLILGVMVYASGRKKKINIIYSLNIIAITLWVAMMVLYRSAPMDTSLAWCTALYIAPTLIASSFLSFLYDLLSRTNQLTS